MSENDNCTGDREREGHDYDIDKRFAHIRVEVLGQEHTDVVRVCEQFPDLPDGVTFYVEHIDAIDLRQGDGPVCCDSDEDDEWTHANYTCPECGSDEWHIQNRIAPMAAFFDPKITHVQCVNCGFLDDSKINTKNTDSE